MTFSGSDCSLIVQIGLLVGQIVSVLQVELSFPGWPLAGRVDLYWVTLFLSSSV